MPRSILNLAFGLVVSGLLFAGQAVQSTPAAAAEQMHKVAVHVDESDPKRMNMALNNVQNLKAYYESKGQPVEIEVVAYGPGLHMLRADTSPVKDRISAMALEIDGLTFSGCGNTLKGMTKKEGKEIEMLSEARVVPSGVVRLVELQEDGYAYVRP
jgi:intracellular sulfur oxidation DsrE/DsrF family protein